MISHCTVKPLNLALRMGTRKCSSYGDVKLRVSHTGSWCLAVSAAEGLTSGTPLAGSPTGACVTVALAGLSASGTWIDICNEPIQTR